MCKLITQLKNLQGNSYYVYFNDEGAICIPTEEFADAEDVFKCQDDVQVITSTGSGCILITVKKRDNTPTEVYKNIVSFVKGADNDQVDKVFELISLYRSLGYYVSTHGRSVNWVHVRVEKIPKYPTILS